MRTLIRATCTTALVLVCLDGHAKAVDRCVTTLEARPAHGETTTPAPRPCPTLVGYFPKHASGARQSTARIGRSDVPASVAVHV